MVATVGVGTAGWVADRRVDGRTAGAVTGLVVLYALAGLVRSHHSSHQALASRYAYVGEIFTLIVVAASLSRLPGRVRVQALVLLLGATLGILHVGSFRHFYEGSRRRAEIQAAEFQTTLRFRDAPDLARGVPLSRYSQVSATDLFRLIDVLHLPVRPLALTDLHGLDRTTVEGINTAMVKLFRTGLRILPDVQATPHTACRGVRGSEEAEIMSASTIGLRSRSGGTFPVYLWFIGGPLDRQKRTIRVFLVPSTSVLLRAPDLGEQLLWHFTVVAAPQTDLQLCGGR